MSVIVNVVCTKYIGNLAYYQICEFKMGNGKDLNIVCVNLRNNIPSEDRSYVHRTLDRELECVLGESGADPHFVWGGF